MHAIAFRFGLDTRDLARWNNLRNPNLIYPGQKLRLAAPGTPAVNDRTVVSGFPAETGTEKVVTLPRPTGAPTGARDGVNRPASEPNRGSGSDAPTGTRWIWPTEGEVTTAVSAMGTKGIRILGRRGQSISAVANGEVVYSGNGLRGYGNLIIIRHDAEFLSAYAHNDKVLVREGEQVRTGQKIAEMGDTGAQQVMLHFELRMNGIAVDPLHYLPRRAAARG
ncbi:MAG: peptidoglycan DD-metalloendopeptidase family protein [Gammaproteobacteria bacterium]|nr:peptidoglycan DD-metalloendopeptidase family protein [Gammaproteobacteria bacterium]